jgi:D-glycero-alpha-D-manno-heptose 1-phosphate guanylyltransferase
MQAIILAGGFGTRLKSAVPHLPKPLAPVAGRPFLCWLLDYMEAQGVRDALLCVHHEAEQMQAVLGARHGGLRLHYQHEPVPLGTGGALAAAMQRLKPRQPVLALNGDSLVAVDYRRMLADHAASGRSISIAARQVDDCRRYSQLTLEAGCVAHYALYGDAQPALASTGLYVLSPHAFEGYYGLENHAAAQPWQQTSGFAESAFSLERDFLAEASPQLRPYAYTQVDYFIDIGVPDDFARAQAEVPQVVAQALALRAAAA